MYVHFARIDLFVSIGTTRTAVVITSMPLERKREELETSRKNSNKRCCGIYLLFFVTHGAMMAFAGRQTGFTLDSQLSSWELRVRPKTEEQKIRSTSKSHISIQDAFPPKYSPSSEYQVPW